jgi:hypothetical protein
MEKTCRVAVLFDTTEIAWRSALPNNMSKAWGFKLVAGSVLASFTDKPSGQTPLFTLKWGFREQRNRLTAPHLLSSHHHTVSRNQQLTTSHLHFQITLDLKPVSVFTQM